MKRSMSNETCFKHTFGHRRIEMLTRTQRFGQGRRQSDTQKIRKAIEADVHQLTMDFDDDASSQPEDSLYNSGNPTSKISNRSPESTMPSASKLNRMRSKSYMALEQGS